MSFCEEGLFYYQKIITEAETMATTKSKKKYFVLDTNVSLHDKDCLNSFKNSHIIVPITTIRELDKFKKDKDVLGYNAREFIRFLDGSSAHGLFNGGVKINKGRGLLSVKTEREPHPELEAKILWDKNVPDLRILNIAYWLDKENQDTTVVLVTKDTNLRMLARAVGIRAEDYETDKLIENANLLYRGYSKVGEMTEDIFRDITKGVNPERLNLSAGTLIENQYLIFKKENGTEVLTVFSKGLIKRVLQQSAFCIMPRNIEQNAALHGLMNQNSSVLTLSGKAGTGKTLLALAAALQQNKSYAGILLARPIVPLSNKDIGYLPGDINSKIGPYMQPLWDNLDLIKSCLSKNKSKADELKGLEKDGGLKIEPLAYIRGTTKNGIFMIIDEAQNLTPHEVKTIITRAGEKTKMVFTGDIHQIDHPYLDSESNGLTHLIEKMKGQPLYTHVNLEKGERSELAELASQVL